MRVMRGVRTADGLLLSATVVREGLGYQDAIEAVYLAASEHGATPEDGEDARAVIGHADGRVETIWIDARSLS